MNLSKSLLVSAVALFASATASYADLVVNITGSTAFRSAAHASILAVMSGETYAYDTDTLGGANRAIFKGTVPGISGTVTVRTSWSGSAQGIQDVAEGNPVTFPVLGSFTDGAGLANQPFTTEAVTAKFTFSDVSQSATEFLTPTLESAPVGVVPFVFAANDGAPASVTNMTDQLFAALYSQGTLPLSLLTGDAADESNFAIALGRNSGSGTRITTLAETGYGIANQVVQYTVDSVTADEVNGLTDVGNGGYSSGSTLRGVMAAKTTNFGGAVMIAYVGASDASAITTGGGKILTYNGVSYSEENVRNGSYSFWGYQQFLNSAGLSNDEQTFKAALIAAIPANTGSAGIALDTMRVIRNGDEGGQIVQNF